jgi:hypothetical protein
MPICRIGQTVLIENGETITRNQYEKRRGEGVEGYEVAFEDLPECEPENKEVFSPDDSPEP